MENEFSYRKELTFEQAEGAAPLPSQLALKEVSDGLKAKMWQLFHDSIVSVRGDWLEGKWNEILRDHHVDRLNLPIDRFNEYKKLALRNYEARYSITITSSFWVHTIRSTTSSMSRIYQDGCAGDIDYAQSRVSSC